VASIIVVIEFLDFVEKKPLFAQEVLTVKSAFSIIAPLCRIKHLKSVFPSLLSPEN